MNIFNERTRTIFLEIYKNQDNDFFGRDIIKKLDLSDVTYYKVVSFIVKEGYAKKINTTGRKKKIILTKKGYKVAENLLSVQNEVGKC